MVVVVVGVVELVFVDRLFDVRAFVARMFVDRTFVAHLFDAHVFVVLRLSGAASTAAAAGQDRRPQRGDVVAIGRRARIVSGVLASLACIRYSLCRARSVRVRHGSYGGNSHGNIIR